MARPERMKSALAGSSPVSPPHPGNDTSQPVAETSLVEKNSESTVDHSKCKRSYYLYTATVDELLNAAEALSATPGAPRGPSDLVNAAVEEYLESLRLRFNDGKPFPKRTGPLARGPRIR